MTEAVRCMSAEELQVAARVAGIAARDVESASRPELEKRLLEWVARAVGASSTSPEELDRASLAWLAESAGIPLEGQPPEVVERQVWERVSDDVARQLMPVWKVASSMAALGPPDALPDERDFLEKVAARLLPSPSAREAMRREWEDICRRPARHHSELTARLGPELETLRKSPELIRPALVLSLVVAMADSNFEMEEARLYDKIASGLGVDPDAARNLKDGVTRAFWDAKEALSPRFSGDEAAAHELSLRAAHISLERLGALADLEEAQVGLVAGLHRSLMSDRDFRKGVGGWKRSPLHWPLSLALGVAVHLRDRLRGDTPRRLLQVLYLAYTCESRDPG